jgi:G3E family GTPase
MPFRETKNTLERLDAFRLAWFILESVRPCIMVPVPVILISGYLGSGKTTFLNHLLTLPPIAACRKAIIMNEFGTLGVDGELITPGDYQRFDLNKGSLYCICIKTEFLKTLSIIADEVQPELLIVEATGVAEPCDLERILDDPGLRGRFMIKGNLCIVDALNFSKVAPYMRSAQDQVKQADGIVVNKADLVEDADLDCLHAVLCSLNPHAPHTTVSYGAMPEDFLQRLRHTRYTGHMASEPPQDIRAVSLQLKAPVSRDAFLAALTSLKSSLLRLKGTVDFGSGPVLLQGVFEHIEESEPPAAACNRRGVVIIFRGMEAADVEQRFASIMP